MVFFDFFSGLEGTESLVFSFSSEGVLSNKLSIWSGGSVLSWGNSIIFLSWGFSNFEVDNFSLWISESELFLKNSFFFATEFSRIVAPCEFVSILSDSRLLIVSLSESASFKLGGLSALFLRTLLLGASSTSSSSDLDLVEIVTILEDLTFLLFPERSVSAAVFSDGFFDV